MNDSILANKVIAHLIFSIVLFGQMIKKSIIGSSCRRFPRCVLSRADKKGIECKQMISSEGGKEWKKGRLHSNHSNFDRSMEQNSSCIFAYDLHFDLTPLIRNFIEQSLLLLLHM